VTAPSDPDELDTKFAEGDTALAWGVEIELEAGTGSIFRSARRVILDGDCAQIQLLDGSYEMFPLQNVRKVLAMRADPPAGYTGQELSEDEIY